MFIEYRIVHILAGENEKMTKEQLKNYKGPEEPIPNKNLCVTPRDFE